MATAALLRTPLCPAGHLRVGEVVEPERSAAKLEHPSSAFAALRHLLPQGEKGEPLHRGRQSPPFEIN